ncbi:uncharacterized protein PAC_11841 [Phialocephala subalpina]|uniref:Uncharacterized protein n=1 Tax=Phialocephala subalpina TaxID=576137 RepID=A0A1L7XA95_9HELO|nr:uncharacterized protein PAC_11841 [Phialocephala subalpina]
MDHRFSALFFQPPRTLPSADDSEITMSGALPDPQTTGKRKSTTMKHLLRKLFGIPRQTTDPLVKNREPTPSALSQQVWNEIGALTKTTSKASLTTLKKTPTSKSGKLYKSTASDSAVVVYPPNPPLPSFRGKDIFHRSSTSTSSASSIFTTHSKRASSVATRDSKFSSISSLPSLATLSIHPSLQHARVSPGPSVPITVSELAFLQSLIRKVARQLKKQEYLTNHLAGNLVHLFSRKEAQIHNMKRLRIQERDMAAREVWRALNLLRTALDKVARAPSTPQSTTRNSSPSSPSSSSQVSSLSASCSPSTVSESVSASISASNSTSTSPRPSVATSQTSVNEHTFNVPLNNLNDTISTLQADLSLHSILNSELKNTIYTACLESRWNGLPGGGIAGNKNGSVNDRIMMHRFVSFVESRIALLEACDTRLGLLVGKIEGFGKREGIERRGRRFPTSAYSFEDKKRPTPCPSVGKASTDSSTSSESSNSSYPTSLTLTLTPPSNSSTPTKDGKSQWKEEYLTSLEISQISSQITKFVGSLTTYGQLIEKTHLALNSDIQTILSLIPIHVPLPSATSARSITTPETSPPSSRKDGERGRDRLGNRLTELPPLYVMPGSGTVCLYPSEIKPPTTPEKAPPVNHSALARSHLLAIQQALAKAYETQRETYATKYWPLIILLPRNWIMFSRLKVDDQSRDVVRHLRREKGQRRAQDGLLLSMIRNLSALVSSSPIPQKNPPLPYHKPVGQESLEEVGKLVGQYWEELLFHLKGVEEERRKKNRETAINSGIIGMAGEKGEGEGKEWTSPAMKWRVFGLVLAERVRLVGEMREEILKGRVGLSGVLLGVFEDFPSEGSGGGEEEEK